MNRRFIRRGLCFSGVLTLLGGAVPVARAETTFSAAFVGNAYVNSGLAYPLVTPVTEVPTIECLAPLDGLTSPVPNCHTNYPAIRARDWGLYSSVCTSATINVNKPKAPANSSSCALGAAGTVNGYCLMNGGQMSGYFVEDARTFHLDMHFSTVGATLLVLGHYRDAGNPSQHGLLVGQAVAAAVPTVDLLIIIFNNCANGTATVFQVSGSFVGVPEPSS